MSLRTALRWSGAIWFLPVLFGVGSVHAVDSLSSRTGYAVSDVAGTSYVIYLLCPLLAGFAAYRMRGWPRFHATLRPLRRGTSVVLDGFWPLLAGGPGVVVATVLVSAWVWPADGATLTVVVLDAATALACVLLGLAAGWALPVVVAAPAVSTGCFLWIAYLPATGSPFLHHLTPTLTGCCAQSVEPSTAALRTLGLLTATVCVGVTGMFASRRWSLRPRVAVAATTVTIVAAAAGIASAWLAGSGARLTLTTVQPRSTALTCVQHDGIQACLWPEGAPRAAEIIEVARTMNPTLRSWGFPGIREIRSDADGPGGAVAVDSTASIREPYLSLSLAAGYVRAQLRCPEGGRQEIDPRVALLAMATRGATPDSLRGEFSPDDIATASSWLSRDDPAGLRAWFFGTVTCEPRR